MRRIKLLFYFIAFSLTRPIGLSFEIILSFINLTVNRAEVIKYRWPAFHIARKAAASISFGMKAARSYQSSNTSENLFTFVSNYVKNVPSSATPEQNFGARLNFDSNFNYISVSAVEFINLSHMISPMIYLLHFLQQFFTTITLEN